MGIKSMSLNHGAAAAACHEKPNGPRPALFISDLHLSPALPQTVAAFETFLQGPARTAAQLFILGDLFEYWLGDDMLRVGPQASFAEHIAHRLAQLSAHG